jgi:hypothetical protein
VNRSTGFLVALLSLSPALAQADEPVIDMHLHAHGADLNGPPPGKPDSRSGAAVAGGIRRVAPEPALYEAVVGDAGPNSRHSGAIFSPSSRATSCWDAFKESNRPVDR